MGDFGGAPTDAAGQERKPAADLEQDDNGLKQEHGLDQDGPGALDPRAAAESSRAKLASEAALPDDKGKTSNKTYDSTFGIKAVDFLVPILDTVVFQVRPRDKSYSMVIDLDSEVDRKLRKAPDAVKDFYKDMRQTQMDHQPIGLASLAGLNAADRATRINELAELDAWLAFPETDADCEQGRELTREYSKRLLERNGSEPANAAEAEKDNVSLSKIYSLMSNDHDYLHNEDEITRRNGMHHLPEAFEGVGSDGQPKTFNLKALAEKHMLSILHNDFKSALAPDERANLAFYQQVLRQVLPDKLLADTPTEKADRSKILASYVKSYAEHDADLSDTPIGVWRAGMNVAQTEYPEMRTYKSGLELTGAEKIYERVNLAEIRQLSVEAHEMRTKYGRTGKRSELAYPDRAHLDSEGLVRAPMREYREGAVLEEQTYLTGVFTDPVLAKYTKIAPSTKQSLRLASWKGTPNDWRLPYWNDNPNTSRIQKQLAEYFPSTQQCSLSNEGAKYMKEWLETGIFENTPEGAEKVRRMNKLAETLIDEIAGGIVCVHDKEARKRLKPGSRRKF